MAQMRAISTACLMPHPKCTPINRGLPPLVSIAYLVIVAQPYTRIHDQSNAVCNLVVCEGSACFSWQPLGVPSKAVKDTTKFLEGAACQCCELPEQTCVN